MSNVVITVNTKVHLWNNYIIKGFEEGLKAETIRLNLIEAMRKEVFGLIASRMKVDDPLNATFNEEGFRIVENIRNQAQKKWNSLVDMCNHHLRTLNMITPEDLAEIWPKDDEDDGYEIGEAEDPEDEDCSEIDEMTAEWPELSEEEEDDEESEDVSDSTAGGVVAESDSNATSNGPVTVG